MDKGKSLKSRSTKGLSASLWYSRACCFVLFFVAASASFHGYYDKWRFMDGDLNASTIGKNNFEAIVDGTAHRPYIYRQLLPTVANWIDSNVADATKDRLFTFHEGKPIGYGARNAPLSLDRKYFLRYRVFYIEEFVFVLLAVGAIFLLLRTAGFSPFISAFTAVILILLMPFVAEYYYDYPELAFMAMVAAMAIKCDWWWIVPVVALATWNKESFLLFIPTLYPLLRHRHSRINAVLGVAAMACASAAVYLLLRLRFEHNAGVTAEFHFSDQIRFVANPSNWLVARESTYGVIHPAPCTIVPMALIAATVWFARRHLSQMIQRHAQIAAVINIPLVIVFCWPGEMRNLSMLYVTFAFTLGANLSRWLGAQSTTIPTS